VEFFVRFAAADKTKQFVIILVVVVFN